MSTITDAVLSHHVFPYLEAGDLANCCAVNKSWNQKANENKLWKQIYPNLVTPVGVSIKKHIGTCSVKSLEQIAQRLRDFAHKIQKNQIGIFECQLLLDPEFSMQVKLEYSENNLPFGQRDPNTPVHKEVCLLRKKLNTAIFHFGSQGFENNSSLPQKSVFCFKIGPSQNFSARDISGKIPEELNSLMKNSGLEILDTRLSELERQGTAETNQKVKLYKNLIKGAAVGTLAIATQVGLNALGLNQ